MLGIDGVARAWSPFAGAHHERTGPPDARADCLLAHVPARAGPGVVPPSMATTARSHSTPKPGSGHARWAFRMPLLAAPLGLWVCCLRLAAAAGGAATDVDPDFPDLPLEELKLRSANLRFCRARLWATRNAIPIM